MGDDNRRPEHPICNNSNEQEDGDHDRRIATHTADFTPERIFISSPWPWEKEFSPDSDEARTIDRGKTAKVDSETTQTMPDGRIVGYR
jgi:hypothetical protein